jgi:hypothetical protein
MNDENNDCNNNNNTREMLTNTKGRKAEKGGKAIHTNLTENGGQLDTWTRECGGGRGADGDRFDTYTEIDMCERRRRRMEGEGEGRGGVR